MYNYKKAIMFFLGLTFTGLSNAAPYVGAQVGLFNFDTGLTKHYYPNGRVLAGYLWEIKNWRLGLEGGFQYDAPAHDSSLRYEYHSFDILGVVDYVIKKKFDVFLKLGRAQYYEERTYKAVSPSYEASNNGHTTKVIFGLGYFVTKNTNLNFSRVTRGDTGFSTGGGAWMLGINYHFHKQP